MSPSHTMSAHWGKQIYTSWRQSRQGTITAASSSVGQPINPLPSPSALPTGGYFGEKQSMDSDRSTGGPSSSSSSSAAAAGWFSRRS